MLARPKSVARSPRRSIATEIVSQAMRGRGQRGRRSDLAVPLGATTRRRRPFTLQPRDGASSGWTPRVSRPASASAGHMAQPFPASHACFCDEEPQYERIALVVQRQFAAIGIDLELEAGAMTDLIARRLGAGEFDTYLLSVEQRPRRSTWTYRFWHSPTSARRRHPAHRYTRADGVARSPAAARTDDETSRAASRDLRQRFYDDPPAAFLAWPETTRAVEHAIRRRRRADPRHLRATLWRGGPPSCRRPRDETHHRRGSSCSSRRPRSLPLLVYGSSRSARCGRGTRAVGRATATRQSPRRSPSSITLYFDNNIRVLESIGTELRRHAARALAAGADPQELRPRLPGVPRDFRCSTPAAARSRPAASARRR